MDQGIDPFDGLHATGEIGTALLTRLGFVARSAACGANVPNKVLGADTWNRNPL
jgi:hypothetical protein